MNAEDRALLFAEIIAAARAGKKDSPFGTIQRREFSRIIRLAKRLYIDMTKEPTP